MRGFWTGESGECGRMTTDGVRRFYRAAVTMCADL
jgi:hypothetical protein